MTRSEKMTKHIVKTATACMPNSCWGRYGKVAVLEVEVDSDGKPASPKMISDRARGVVKVVEVWDRLNMGTTARCAYRVALAEAEVMAAELNR